MQRQGKAKVNQFKATAKPSKGKAKQSIAKQTKAKQTKANQVKANQTKMMPESIQNVIEKCVFLFDRFYRPKWWPMWLHRVDFGAQSPPRGLPKGTPNLVSPGPLFGFHGPRRPKAAPMTPEVPPGPPQSKPKGTLK